LADRIVPMAKLGQPWWEKYGAVAVAARTEESAPTLHGVATDWVQIQRSRYENTNTLNAALSPVLKHVLPAMAYYDVERRLPRPITDMRPAVVDEFVAVKVRERAVLRELPDISTNSTTTSYVTTTDSPASWTPRSSAFCSLTGSALNAAGARCRHEGCRRMRSTAA
jgi:hypothetical protein